MKRVAENEDSGAEELLETIKDYAATRYDLARLKLVDKSSEVLASLVAFALVFVAALFFLFFVSYAVAGSLSVALHDDYAGFFIVSGFYLVVSILLFLLRSHYLESPLGNRFIKELLKNH